MTNYLLPAIKELKGKGDGREAGRVYHEFAFFCDQQLQSADGLDEFSRVQKIRQQKEAEVKDLGEMVNNAPDKQKKELLKLHYVKARQWYKLDDAEYQRLKQTRENFLQRSLENYLLSLRACDDYANDVLRFCAMWLDNSGNAAANVAVGKFLPEVASRKFVPLMNQLSSRLLDSKDEFQEHLFDLLLRICTDHPFHGMYQIFASSKSKGGKDDLALSRHAAANRLSEELRKGSASSMWVAIHNSNISFIRFALDQLPDDNKHKSGAKVPLTKIPSGHKLVQEILNLTTKIPPPTLKIPIRIDCDYRSVPILRHFEPNFSIAGGVSAPKIITMSASDGSRMKALLKGGNDDLRQDSIMEQVFEQVSNLLKDHRSTRQRQLGIRTYKVLPLTMNAGIIEFVSHTIPLHDFSLPAHQKYHPHDWKPNRCRKEIADAQSKPLATRTLAYRTAAANFHPILRHFFFERFLNPDEWFSKRLAYSRSTAAISMLGHVLGLGDRHGHNILLDEQTGEVVHIDLGVAFEAGRVLPVPEVVPFRLTRDIVDGMGLAGVEGVFRRCCHCTLSALRADQYSIMTILDVLRYDPLYSWSVSPLRLQRMQEKVGLQQQQQQQVAEGAAAGEGLTALANQKAVNNPSEADRALAVVARKLGKSLSVEASVNELIQQALDERNLAVLYCGWAAYA
jgi:serine-protein kinase ATM